MKIELTIKKEYEVKHLQATVEVRYWEDATVNGVEDSEGNLLPLRIGDNWCPKIEIETGKIIGWPQGTKAEIHFKVCDAGHYSLLDEKDQEILSMVGYVPRIMSPKEPGFGDYIIMDINESGFIQHWNTNITREQFQEDFSTQQD